MRIDRAKMANKALLGTNLRSAPVCPRVRRWYDSHCQLHAH